MVNFLERHKKKFKIAEDIIFVVIFAAEVILLVSVILGKSPFFYVEGPSMHPTLENGDLIIIDRTSFDNLKINDIIIFNSPVYNFRIVHRIIDIRSSSGERVLITQGDNNHVPDPSFVQEKNYVAKYIGIRIPYAGFLGQALAPPVNYIIIILLLIYLVYVGIYKAKKE